MRELDKKTLKIFTAKSQADKAINSLKGILLGIMSDGIVNKKETAELHQWVIIHKELINRNPFKEFMIIVEEATRNGIPPKEAIDDLFWLCQKYESDNYYYNPITSDLQILQGICHGILSDGIINEEEVFNLNKWLGENEHLNTYYPYDEIRSLVLSIVSDKKVDEEEKLVLKAYLNQFVKLTDKDIKKRIDSETNGIQISAHCTSEPNVTFKGKTFCITGILKRGNRKELAQQIEILGGIPTGNVTKKTDYLIVGDNGNPAWAFACYGRKVEKALNLRKEGHVISLIHEFDFSDIIEDMLY